MRTTRNLTFVFILALGLQPTASLRAGPLDEVAREMEARTGGTKKDYETKIAAADAAWDVMPMTARTSVLTDHKADAYGDFDPRANHAFKQSEHVLSYIEPVGCVFKESDGLLSYGFTIDLTLRDASGQSVFHIDKYAALDTHTRSRRHDLFFNSDLGIKDVPPGLYTLEFVFHDANSPKTMTVMQAFKVTN